MFTRRTVLNLLAAGGALRFLGSSSRLDATQPPAHHFRIWAAHSHLHSAPGDRRHPRSPHGRAQPVRRSSGNRAAHPFPKAIRPTCIPRLNNFAADSGDADQRSELMSITIPK